jgi:hypothetical protein
VRRSSTRKSMGNTMNLILEVISWDEKAALRRDAVDSQVIDAEGASVALNPGRSL